jgi:folate-binding protein YgfZ
MKRSIFDPGFAAMSSLLPYSLLELTGDDAATFLQGQITQDVMSLDAQTSRRGAYCTAKGRVLANFIMWRDVAAGAIFLIVPQDVVAAFAKRLAMFVLRAKVKIRVRDDLGVSGEVGCALNDGQVEVLESGWRIGAGAGRCWRVGMPESIPAAPDQVAWAQADIALGRAWVLASTQDMFIPQTLNLDLIGGVSFTKGCYPGQEVVARSHYLGKLKRRMMRVGGARGAQPGQDVWSSSDSKEPCGRVINAAGNEALIEMNLSARGTPLRLGQPDGPLLELLDLPYSLEKAA